MHLADRRAVVVDEADAALGIIGLQAYFFGDFAEHRLAVWAVKEGRVIGADMSADADRAQRLQATLRCPLAAGVMEDLSRTAENYIRNDLLEARIGLHFRARPVAEVFRIEQPR